MHTHLLNRLKQLISDNIFPHSMLLIGPEGIGKSACAHELASHLLQCEQNLLLSNPEFIVCGSKEAGLTVDEVRTTHERTAGTIWGKGNRVVLVEHIHNASISAANALLKAIEEPKKNTFFILTATHTQTVPQTIISRCATIYVSHESNDTLQSQVQHLEPILAKKMLTWAAGRPQLLKHMVQDDSVKKQWLNTAQELIELLTSASDKRLDWVEQNIPKQVNRARTQLPQKIDAFTVMLRALLHAQSLNNTSMCQKITKAIDQGIIAKKQLSQNVQPKGVMDMYVLSLPQLNRS